MFALLEAEIIEIRWGKETAILKGFAGTSGPREGALSLVWVLLSTCNSTTPSHQLRS